LKKEKTNSTHKASVNNGENNISKLLLDNVAEPNDDYKNEANILDSKIKKRGVNNIAVVAGFGAGKSSLIETYLRNHREKKPDTFIKVSLATFNDISFSENDVERSILQQLFFNQPPSKLPHSKIERTKKPLKRAVVPISGIVSLLVACIALLALQMTSDIAGQIFGWEMQGKGIFVGILFGVAMVLVFVSLWLFLWYKGLSKIIYKDLEVSFKEIDKSSYDGPKSLINKFADEVLYFFGQTKIDLVIFEEDCNVQVHIPITKKARR